MHPCQEPTFRFASEFGAQSQRLQDILKMERDAEAERMRIHWDQVQKQQEEAKELRKLIKELKAKLAVKEPKLEKVLELERCLRSSLEPRGFAGSIVLFRSHM